MNATQYKQLAITVLVGIAILVQGAPGQEPLVGVIPNDPLFPLQWDLLNTGQTGGTPGADINAPKAWEITPGDPNIIVAILGEGIDLDHPELVNNLVPGIDFYDKDDSPYPTPGTGSWLETMGAGLIAAEGDNGIGVTGVTWHCKIMPVRIVRSERWGLCSEVTPSDHAAAYRWAAAQGADIIVTGWLFQSSNPLIHSAIIDVTKTGGIGRNGKGCVVITGAAFDNSYGFWRYPAMYPETIAVGATDDCDMRWAHIHQGPELDLMAPCGWDESVVCRIPTWSIDISGPAGANVTDYTECGGGAVGLAAGVAALMLSIEPNLTSQEVRHYLCRSAHDLGEPGRDDDYGWGRVDARAALDMVLAKRCDLNNDWKIDNQDLAIMNAAIDANDLSADIAPPAKRDGIIDEQDLELMMQYLGAEIPEMGLIAHWKLDEPEGDIAYDSAGICDGALLGDTVWQPTSGMVDGALQFDGIDDCVSTEFILNPADGAFSIFVWVKGGAPGQVVLSQMGSANWLLTDPVEGNLVTELKGPGRGANELLSQTIITDGNWHRIGLVWDGSHRTLYVDDVVVAEDTQGNLEGSENGLYIGTGTAIEPGSFWSGLIDDVRIYDAALRAEEIEALTQ